MLITHAAVEALDGAVLLRLARLMSEFGTRGYDIYRSNIAFMDEAAALQGSVRTKANRRLKRALDPDGIFAPGKSGIHF